MLLEKKRSFSAPGGGVRGVCVENSWSDQVEVEEVEGGYVDGGRETGRLGEKMAIKGSIDLSLSLTHTHTLTFARDGREKTDSRLKNFRQIPRDREHQSRTMRRE